jgi:hypothetical protein
LATERRALQAEEPRGRLLVALGAAERFLDEPVLELLDGGVEVETLLAERRRGIFFSEMKRADRRRQVIDADVPLLGEDHEALEQVLELAHVARASRTPRGRPWPPR